jgi:RNA polymerase sigma-70 factor (ECF subfamily)
VARLAAGEEPAFAELYDRYGPRLYRTALGLLARREDAEDCVQEVFAALVRSRERLAGVRDLAAYLFVSLRRRALRRAAERRQQPAYLEIETAQPEPPPADPRAAALTRALRSLSAEQREVVALKIEGQLTFAEIGRVLAISPNTAASRYRYALERLRDRLNPDGNET